MGDDTSRIDEVLSSVRLGLPVNLLGLPLCAVPVGCDDGLPQGVQLVDVRFRKDLLLDPAQAIEHRALSLTPIRPRITVGV